MSFNRLTQILDKYEEYHLRSRGTDAYYAIYACCYINDNRSNLEELCYVRLNEVNELMNIIEGDQIHNMMGLDQGERVENDVPPVYDPVQNGNTG